MFEMVNHVVLFAIQPVAIAVYSTLLATLCAVQHDEAVADLFRLPGKPRTRAETELLSGLRLC